MRKYINCLGLVLSLIAVSSSAQVTALETVDSYHRIVIMDPTMAPSGPVCCYECNADTHKCVVIRCEEK